MLPFQDVLIVSLILSLVMSVIYRVLVNPEDIRKIKREMEFYREKVNKAQKSGNKGEVNKYTNEMLKMSGKQMGKTMRPMFASMIIFLVALSWLGSTYAEMMVNLPFSIFGFTELNWFWWYLIITLPCTIVFRKALGVE